jgi:hypothetical protein
MALGALLWVAGNVLWLTEHPLSTLALWWAVFLIVTIAGERLELGRMIPQGRISSFIYFAGISILLMGLLATLFRYGLAVRVIAVGLLFLAFWLFRYDLASRTIRSKGVTRYIAACMLLGYFELSVAGLIGLFYGGVRVGPIYDAFLHSMFLGFVVSMIFGHAPIIFPGVTGRQIRYHPAFYIHLVLLHLSLLLRVGSDLSSWHIGRQWGAMLNAIALLVFLGNTFFGMRGQRAQQQAGSLTS